jgi:Cu(I)/Ag(I) efflux system membrane fusion protein
MVNVRAPMSGTVVSRSVYEGQYVETNDPLFEIGDFSHMWFVFDAYEPDLPWIKPGQIVELSVPSLPGQVLTAPITFIDPNLDGATRTARVRVILDNSRRLLLHKQTASAVVRTETPETLLVPRSAVLQHGGQPVVFLARDHEAYAARQIQLGRIGDTEVEVLSGLKEGDRVVTEGALLLDGQAQLAHAAVNTSGVADPGPTIPAPVSVAMPAHHGDAHALLKTLAFAAADGADALASDDLAGYRKQLPALRAALDAYLAGFGPAARGPLAAFTGKLADGPDLDAARRAFEPFSTAVADAAKSEHLHHQEQLWIYQCPMTPVLGTGRWLSKTRQLRNPFFGSAMLECGDEVN